MHRTGLLDPADTAGIPTADTEPYGLVAGRMPLFAAAWVISAVTWSVVLAVGGVPLGPIAVARAAELAVLLAMWIAAGAARTESAALRIVAGGCALLVSNVTHRKRSPTPSGTPTRRPSC
jgi:hypothetical protein